MADGRKNNGGHSTKGRAGRPPKPVELNVMELTKDKIPGAFQTVANILEDPKSSNKDKLAAAKLLIEYYFGKPKQQTDITTAGEKIQHVINLGLGKKPNE